MHPSISQSNNAKSKGLRLDIGVAFARLQLSYPHNSGGNEFRIHAELLFLEIAISERDFADFESHAARFERAYQGTVSIFGSFLSLAPSSSMSTPLACVTTMILVSGATSR